jgi:hypothetical protein
VAVAAIRIQLVRKSIGFYHSVGSPAFFIVNDELRDRLKVTFDGRGVEQLSTFDISVFNDGNAAISPADFIEPISISFPDASHIFGVLVTEASPSNLGVTVSRNSGSFVIGPVLLNPGDEFTLQFLVELPANSFFPKPEIGGRIVGVRSLLRKPHRVGAKRRAGYYLFRSSRFLVPLGLGLLVGLFGNMLWRLLRLLLGSVIGAA